MSIIKRTQFLEILKWLGKRQYIILKGARRVGKTTLMREIEAYSKNMNPEFGSAFLNCDNLDFLEQSKTPADLIFLLSSKYSFDSQLPFILFLDEFQHIKNAGLFLKNLYDEYPLLKIIASGSSALEITKNTEFLTGRSVDFLISPLSFQEFFSYKKPNISLPDDLNTREQWYRIFHKDLDLVFNEYISWGGYPEIVLANTEREKKILLGAYIQKYIQKDIVQFLHVENISGFNNLLRLLADDIGNLLNENEISNTLGIANKTVRKYIDIIEGTYVIRRTRPYYTNVRSEISKMPKQYFADIGVRNFLLHANESVSEKINKGAEVENFIENYLVGMFDSLKNLFFYRTVGGSEIDFIVEKEYKTLDLIEVKYKTKVGKIRAFTEFSKKYPETQIQKIVITKNTLKKIDDIQYIPAALFALMN